MSQIELNDFKHFHFIGIGGVGVSAVARQVLHAGHKVSGSDVRESCLTIEMRNAGADVFIGHNPENLRGADLVVVSTAIPETNQELLAARKAGIPVVHRSMILDAVMRGRKSIGVTGTNGKGSVSAMITWLLECAGVNPAFAIGARLLNFQTNSRPTDGETIVCELDESDGSFTNIRPDVMVINNLEADHLNYYKDLEGLLALFSGYLAGPMAPRRLHANGDDENIAEVRRRSGFPAVTFGCGPSCDFVVREIRTVGMTTVFSMSGPDGDMGEFILHIPGEYNAMNMAGAISVAIHEGVPLETVRAAVGTFRGLENRFSCVRTDRGLVVKDYISHPTGIRCVINTARKFAAGRILCVFKPYRFTMIHYLGDEYSEAFKGADLTFVTRMYTAGEVPIPGIDTDWLVGRIRDAGSEVTYVPEMTDIIPEILKVLRDGDTIIFFGGDDLFQLADELVQRLGAVSSAG
ncbi:MAG TPA: UDP-N-acetylmuramate--L-alanine ligase [Myxococcota bacterium]|nr:UDP-N-acetylmuramate--L-alanine ligase [Myxococcota bacterium]